MQYLVSFLEGVVTFISPCLLPMLPLHLTYFAGGGERKLSTTLKNTLGFILGFTLVFMLLGALAGTFGSFLRRYQLWVNIVSGLVVIFFGLSFLGVFQLSVFRGVSRKLDTHSLGFFSAFLFGLVFSVGWTPCVGAFLGSALMLASQRGHVLEGMLMLFTYSLGLGVPFLLSALLIDRLRTAFSWIRSHYAIINRICGGFLVAMGILMATGLFGRLLTVLS